MGARGRKSAASLAVVGVQEIERPDPSPQLTTEQGQEWIAIINRMPADWFPRETHGMLEQYCRHIVSSRRVADLVEDLLAGKVLTSNWVEDYDRILKMQEREGRAMSSLATRLRITQQTLMSKGKTRGGTSVKKPWAD